MKVLIKQANIICSSSPFNGQVKDILITDGLIEKIADNLQENADEIIANDNMHVSIGWMDVFAHFTDPGYEQKETLATGAAAATGGSAEEEVRRHRGRGHQRAENHAVHRSRLGDTGSIRPR